MQKKPDFFFQPSIHYNPITMPSYVILGFVAWTGAIAGVFLGLGVLDLADYASFGGIPYDGKRVHLMS